MADDVNQVVAALRGQPLPDVGPPLVGDGGQVSPGMPWANKAADIGSKVVQGAIAGGIQHASTPGALMQPNPYPDNSEEANWYNDQRDKIATQWGPQQALNSLSPGMAMAEPGAAGILGGRLAHTAKIENMFKAEDMLDAGKRMSAIRNETGWFQTPTDNQWKFEIPDTYARLNQHGLNYAKEGDFRMGPAAAMMDHPALYEAYPQLANDLMYNTVLQKPHNGVGIGSFTPSSKIIEIEAPDLRRARVIGLHELQHGVQDIEGFSGGGNPSDMARMQQYAKVPPHEIKSNPVDAYERLGGEVEARNVMTRSLMSPTELAQRHPWQTMDTPWEHQLHYDPISQMVLALRRQ